MTRILLTLLIFLAASPAMAWWNPEWTARKAITLNTATDGADLKEGLANVPVLVRLHTGNFDFLSANPEGSDLRFIAEDDKTPLKFHIEKFDAVNQLALIWVQVPKLQPNNTTQQVWLYFGNEQGVPAGDAKGSYDVNQLGVWHLGEAAGAPQDVTGYANHAAEFTGYRVAAAVIGGGMGFDGKTALNIPASPSIKFTAAAGMTWSAWLKPASADQNAVLMRLQDGGNSVAVILEGGKVFAETNNGGTITRTAPGADLAAATWSHVAVTLGPKLVLYVNGVQAGEAAGTGIEMGGAQVVGQGYTGDIDEINLANVARTADWIKVAALGQGAEAKLTVYGEDESDEGGGEASYFGVILQSVTLDGWVVIVILMIMLGISVMVMATKAMLVGKTDKANQEFLEAFRGLKREDTAALDADDNPDEADLKDAGVASMLFGKHDHFQNASLYRIYHAGIQEVKKRVGERAKAELSPQALNAIRATLDGTLVRENQKLNSLMVLLTIAISGGPFLGLLGTVVGVMITFAAIAATGDVNVAAIAPGIAAALVATVAGLAVAIPALFGYNYLGSRIKSIGADMHVFVDEYIAKIAETYSREA